MTTETLETTETNEQATATAADELAPKLERLIRTDPQRLIAVCDLGAVLELGNIDILRKRIDVGQHKLAVLRGLKDKALRAIVSEQPTAAPGTQPAN